MFYVFNFDQSGLDYALFFTPHPIPACMHRSVGTVAIIRLYNIRTCHRISSGANVMITGECLLFLLRLSIRSQLFSLHKRGS